MTDIDDIADATNANATGPKSVTVDGNTVSQHSLPDQIELEKYRKANTQAASTARLIFNKCSPPGAA